MTGSPTAPQQKRDEHLWMLDLDEDRWPWRAHLITQDDGVVRVTACGKRVTQTSHPRGWWGTRSGELPLSGPDDIHCGRLDVEALAITAGGS